MVELGRLVRRNLLAPIRTALRDTSVVTLNGARQTGKTTLARQVMTEGYRATFRSLDDLDVRGAASRDPAGFISGLDGNVVIDEVQLVPGLFRAIKASVDRDRRPGRFLLTGSANVLMLPGISESLAGRTEILTTWPFSQGELSGRTETFVDAVFRERFPPVAETDDLRHDLVRRAVVGGYPEVVARRESSRRTAWFDSYISTIVQRDAREVAGIEGLTELPRLLRLLAARSASVLNVTELSRAMAMPLTTLRRYLGLLEAIFLVRRIPAWSGNLGRRLVHHPKLVMLDAGLLGHLLGIDAARFAADPTLVGPLLETFVAAELGKQLGWSSGGAELFHYRSHSGAEVDLVLERRDGLVVGVEVKASSTVAPEDFRGLREMSAALKSRFRRGVVLHTGQRIVPFAANLHAMPMSALWRL